MPVASHETVASEAPPSLDAVCRLSCESARWNRTERSPRLPPDLRIKDVNDEVDAPSLKLDALAQYSMTCRMHSFMPHKPDHGQGCGRGAAVGARASRPTWSPCCPCLFATSSKGHKPSRTGNTCLSDSAPAA